MSLLRRIPAHYWATVSDFVHADPEAVLGTLVGSDSGTSLDSTQRDAWIEEISLLKTSVRGIDGSLYLEFEIPRLGSRVDSVVVSGSAIIPIEFKCGERAFTTGAYNQAWDYALDLKYFHDASHAASIFPILVATRATTSDKAWESKAADGVWAPRRCHAGTLAQALQEAVRLAAGPAIDAVRWGQAAYRPTPTIIEAARALYAHHTVEAITRNDAGATNLSVTSGAIEDIVERARRTNRKSIVFVTGVPGAGKTLVGLDVATRKRDLGDDHAVFLSGNGPLVAVLREALIRDELSRLRPPARKSAVRQKVQAFVQNVHHFRDEGIRLPDSAPHDRVVIFDEAQRAWDLRKTADFMKRRKGVSDFSHSESAFLISYLQRHEGWAVIVCLVGGGQEIHDGEAGIKAWLDAAREALPHWDVHMSPHLLGSEYAIGNGLEGLENVLAQDERLHLATSMRSFRSEHVADFVKAALDCDESEASRTLLALSGRYPIRITRNLDHAKQWIRSQARGSERYGLVASSQAQRLKPHAIDVRVEINPIHWFLADRTDTRSSYYLEDAATEFQVQGLELDWTCVTWDADLRLQNRRWHYHSFRGSSWQNVNKPDRRRYMLNAYRVLLTRARQGMTIFVPPGDRNDPTRSPGFYDETYDYFSGIGIPQL